METRGVSHTPIASLRNYPLRSPQISHRNALKYKGVRPSERNQNPMDPKDGGLERLCLLF
jgi:hypothetical protein